MGGISLFGYRRYVRPSRVHSQLGAPVITATTRLQLSGPRAKAPVAILTRIGGMLPTGKKDAATKVALTMAGYRSEHALQVFYRARLVSVATAFLLALVLHAGDGNPMMHMLLLVGGSRHRMAHSRLFAEEKSRKPSGAPEVVAA